MTIEDINLDSWLKDICEHIDAYLSEDLFALNEFQVLLKRFMEVSSILHWVFSKNDKMPPATMMHYTLERDIPDLMIGGFVMHHFGLHLNEGVIGRRILESMLYSVFVDILRSLPPDSETTIENCDEDFLSLYDELLSTYSWGQGTSISIIKAKGRLKTINKSRYAEFSNIEDFWNKANNFLERLFLLIAPICAKCAEEHYEEEESNAPLHRQLFPSKKHSPKPLFSQFEFESPTTKEKFKQFLRYDRCNSCNNKINNIEQTHYGVSRPSYGLLTILLEADLPSCKGELNLASSLYRALSNIATHWSNESLFRTHISESNNQFPSVSPNAEDIIEIENQYNSSLIEIILTVGFEIWSAAIELLNGR